MDDRVWNDRVWSDRVWSERVWNDRIWDDRARDATVWDDSVGETGVHCSDPMKRSTSSVPARGLRDSGHRYPPHGAWNARASLRCARTRRPRLWSWLIVLLACLGALLPCSVGRGSVGGTETAGRPPDPALAEIERILENGQFEQAEAAARAELERLRVAGVDDSLRYVPLFDFVVDAMRSRSKLQSGEARRLAERSLAIREALLPPDDPAIATSLSGLGRVLTAMQRLDEAEPVLERALAIRRAQLPANDPLTGRSLSDLGLLAISQGRPTVAEGRFRDALAILGVELGADHPRLVRIRISLAIALHGQARFDEALDELAEADRVDRQAGRADHPEVGVLHNCRGSTLLALGRYAEADRAFEQALAIFERNFGPDDLELTRPLTSRGAVATREGRYADAIAFHQRALAIGEAKLGANHPLVAQFLNNIAGVYWNLGALDDAQRYAERAHAIREALLPPTHPELAQSYRSLGILAEERHDQPAAESHYRKALAAYEASSGPKHPDVAIVLWRLAGLLREQERVAEALAFAARALAIGEDTPLQHHSDFATNVEVYGTLLALEGDCDAALAQYERARDIQATALGEGHPLVAHADLMRASALTALGRRSEARALALAVEQAGREHLLLTARAMPEELALDYQSIRASGLDLLLQLSAESDTEPSPEEIAETWNAVVLSRGLIIEEMARRHRAYNSDPTDEAARHAHARAVERYVRLLVEGPSDDPASFRAALDSARVERDRSERALLEGSASLRAEIQRARAGLKEVLAALPRDAALVSFVRHDVMVESGDGPRDVRATAAACTGKSDGQRYLAFLQVGPTAPPLRLPLGSAAEIDRLVERWRSETIHPVARGTEEARGTAYARAAADLAARIWVPIRAQLGTTRRLFIVPDGSLHGVAFAALPGVTAPFAIEEGFSFQSLNAERDLLPTEERPAARARLLALADPDYDLDPRRRAPAPSPEFPSGNALSLFRGERAHCPEFERVRWDRLPQTRREVEEVTAIWKETHAAGPDQVEILSGSRASEAAFKTEAPGATFLHLATHGFFLGADCALGTDDQRGIGGLVAESAPPAPDPPATESARSLQLAGLVLAGANHRADAGPEVEDGILSAEEIAALDLRTVQLAVLSACDTGLGQPRPGEGLLGLRRALQIAGAQSVVMSLWSIEDTATRAWMEQLYRARFTQEGDIPASVASASLAILADRRAAGRTDHPFYWAAFLASGDWR